MDYSILVFAAVGLLCAHYAWMIAKVMAIEKRTAHFDASLRASESVADRIDADPSPLTFAERSRAGTGDPFVELIRHLEDGHPSEDKRDEGAFVPAPSTLGADAARPCTKLHSTS